MKLSPEEGVIYTLTPMTLYTVLGSIETGLTAGSPASISDYLAPFGLTLETMIQMQWSSCGALVPLAVRSALITGRAGPVRISGVPVASC